MLPDPRKQESSEEGTAEATEVKSAEGMLFDLRYDMICELLVVCVRSK